MALPEINITNGTLVDDVQLRFTNSGKAVANFRTASNSRRKNPDTGQWENGDSTFLTVNVWGELGENVAQFFQKGSKVTVKGALKQREYEKDGQKRTVFEVEAYEVSVPVSRFKADESGSQGQAAAPRPNNRNQGGFGNQQGNDPWGSQPATPGGFGNAENPPF